MFTKSQQLFERAQLVMPGGVNSPVRAFRAVGGNPIFIASGKGSRITDVDGGTYIDCVGSGSAGHGPLPSRLEALAKLLATGTSFEPTEAEVSS
jgi:glutamate-1-semialdehyde 2,1-aminomutase